ASARQGRCVLPLDVLAEAGLSPEAVIAAPDAEPVRLVCQRLAARGRRLLAEAPARRLPRHVIAAALPAVLARRDLRRVPFNPLQRGLGDRLAVVFAAMIGRL